MKTSGIENPAIARARELILAHGWNSTAFQIVNPGIALSNEAQVSFKTLYAIAEAFSGNAPIRVLNAGSMRAAGSEVRWLKRRIMGQKQ